MMRTVGILALSALLFAGCHRSDESLAKRAGKKVGETVTDFAKGVGAGVDKQLNVNVELGKDLVDAGLSKTVAKGSESQSHAITVYLLSTKPFKGTLVSQAMNAEGLEIGRAATDVDLAASDAKYVTFTFPAEMDMQLVAKYAVGAKK